MKITFSMTVSDRAYEEECEGGIATTLVKSRFLNFVPGTGDYIKDPAFPIEMLEVIHRSADVEMGCISVAVRCQVMSDHEGVTAVVKRMMDHGWVSGPLERESTE